MSDPFVEVRIANIPLKVRPYQSPEKTKAIAEQITEQVRAIEKTSGKIDTQAFALQAAYELAVELDIQRQRSAAETQELLRAVSMMADRLEALINTAK